MKKAKPQQDPKLDPKLKKSLERFERTARPDKRLKEFFDPITLEYLVESQQFANRLDRGEVSPEELCRVHRSPLRRRAVATLESTLDEK